MKQLTMVSDRLILVISQLFFWPHHKISVLEYLFYIVLKNIFRQPRPMTRKADDEYGMPSSHSQFLWFFAIYMLLFVWIRLKHLSNPNTIWMWIWKAAVSAGCVFASIVVSVSRYWTEFIYFSIFSKHFQCNHAIFLTSSGCTLCITQYHKWLLVVYWDPFLQFFGSYLFTLL